MHADYLIEFFVAAKEGTLLKAASALSLSQPSLSRHLRSLETSLGLSLIRRSSSGIELTEDGRFIYTKAADIAEIVDEINFYASQKKNRVVTLLGLSNLPFQVRAILEMKASIEGDIGGAEYKFLPKSAFTNESIMSALNNGELDLYFTYHSDEFLQSLNKDFEMTNFCKVDLVALMEPSHPLARKEYLQPSDLGNQLLVHAESGVIPSRPTWVELKTVLRDKGLSYTAETRFLEHESDWFDDLGSGILILPAGYNAVGVLTAFGKTVLSVNDMHYTLTATYKADNSLAKTIASHTLLDV